MPSYKALLVLGLLAIDPVFGGPENEDKRTVITKYSTITDTILSAITTTAPITIETEIETPGVKTIIPNALTMTFSGSAYLWLETQGVVTRNTTSYKTRTIPFVTTILSTGKPLPTDKINTIPTTFIQKASTTTSGTLSQKPSSTTVSSVLPTKKIDGCNVEGTASSGMTENFFGSLTVSDILQCQIYCAVITQCISYSFNAKTGLCEQYHSFLNVKPNKSGTFFSQKYPSDGSNFCYGNSQIG